MPGARKTAPAPSAPKREGKGAAKKYPSGGAKREARRRAAKEAAGPDAPKKLTVKQELFVEAYLGAARGNSAEAVKLAGYSDSSRNYLYVRAAELLSLPHVQEAIKARLAQAKKCLQADEVLAELTEQALLSIDDFLTGTTLDFNKARALGRMRFIKSLKHTKYGVAIELVDSQAALFKLGQYHKLFTEKHEVTGAGGGPLVAQIVRMPAKESPDAWSKRSK